MLITLGRGLSPFYKHDTNMMPRALRPHTIFDVDATISRSYPGEDQILKNLADSPAHGTAQSAYDFALGSSTGIAPNDPAFYGTPGNHGAYFQFDGDDLLSLINGNTAFLNNMPKTTEGSLPMTLAIAFRPTDEPAGKTFMGSFQTNMPAIRLQCTSSEQLRLQQSNGSSTVSTDSYAMMPDTDYVAIFSLSADGTWAYWINETKNTGALSLLSTTEDAGAFRLMNGVADGTRFYAASLFNISFSNKQAASLLAMYRKRHKRIYA